MGDSPDDRWDAGTSADTVSTEPAVRQRRPWTWAIGTLIATSTAWALTLHLTGYGNPSLPDLHHYQLSESPCGGYNLKPLTDAFGTRHIEASAADIEIGTTLDKATCTLVQDAYLPIGATHWKAQYKADFTVELHKRINPATEFEDRNRSGDFGITPTNSTKPDPTDYVMTPIDDLGDKAYLLTDGINRAVVTVLHGGAILVINVLAVEQWAGPGNDLPSDANGNIQSPPSIKRLEPALINTARSIMIALTY